MATQFPLLVQYLRNPERLAHASLSDWDRLIPQARVSLLLGHLYSLLERAGSLRDVPDNVLQHLYSCKVVSDAQHQSVDLEAAQLKKAMSQIQQPLILLKGGAYVVSKLQAGKGRLTSDIDLLVPKEGIDQVEGHLSNYGWLSAEEDDYDQRYYREWMHEIPPVQHEGRGTVLDIHHTILPPTARYSPDPIKLLDCAQESKIPGVFTLASEDMVIHSATHLFHEGELEHGLRDLVDIKELLKEFGEDDPGFWKKLVPRARELDLERPLYYGLRYARIILAAEIPEQVMVDVKQSAPGVLARRLLDYLFLHALMPAHPSCDRPLTGIARFLLYVRSHYLRMPLRLLVPHLVRKAWKRRLDKPEDTA